MAAAIVDPPSLVLARRTTAGTLKAATLETTGGGSEIASIMVSDKLAFECNIHVNQLINIFSNSV